MIEHIRYKILVVSGVISLIIICLISPIEQNCAYHSFSDSYVFFNVNNFWNVISNIPFMFCGVLGLYKLKIITNKNIQYVIFFAGIILVSFGSGYYHSNPNNSTLIWDRLPMTIVFMSLFSIIISEFIDFKKGYYLLFPLLLLGLSSVFYWVFFNDLRPYVLIQFYPMLAIPIILILFKSNYSKIYGYWLMLLAYVLAKVCEYYDAEIFNYFKVISGHSLKHIVSALGLFILLYTYNNREKYEFKNSK